MPKPDGLGQKQAGTTILKIGTPNAVAIRAATIDAIYRLALLDSALLGCTMAANQDRARSAANVLVTAGSFGSNGLQA